MTDLVPSPPQAMDPGSVLPSPPASPTASTSSLSSLSMPTNMSEGGFFSDFAWSSRAPSPPHLHTGAAGELRIPELELTTSTKGSSAVLDESRARIVVVGSGPAPSAVDEELISALKSSDEPFMDHSLWEEWEEISDGLSIRISYCDKRDVWIGYIPQDRNEATEIDFLAKIERYLTRPFDRVLPLINPQASVTPDLRSLLANSAMPYFTAVVVATSTPPTPYQLTLLSSLSPLVPTLPVPPPPRGITKRRKRCISAFRPLNAMQLRNGLLKDRVTRAMLTEEVVEGFLRWREHESSGIKLRPPSLSSSSSKADTPQTPPTVMAPFTDPLNLRSLVYLTFSLLPLPRFGLTFPNPSKEFPLSFCLGAFFAGLGVGLVLANSGGVIVKT